MTDIAPELSSIAATLGKRLDVDAVVIIVFKAHGTTTEPIGERFEIDHVEGRVQSGSATCLPGARAGEVAQQLMAMLVEASRPVDQAGKSAVGAPPPVCPECGVSPCIGHPRH